MLLYGTIQNLITTTNMVIFNYSSLNESYPSLYLFPPKEFGRDYGYEFDMVYAEYIFSNDTLFCNFMQIIYSLYLGKDVFLLVDDWVESVNESLLKLIQQRYGYNAYYIGSMEDFMEAEDSSFSAQGLMNLDADKERLSFIIQSTNGEVQ